METPQEISLPVLMTVAHQEEAQEVVGGRPLLSLAGVLQSMKGEIAH